MELPEILTFDAMSPRELVLRIWLGLKMAFSKRSYLVKTGFMYSKIKDSLRNKDGEYLPWMNYSIIRLFDERLTNDLTVFEYGSGSSTMYFAQRVGSIMSVEYNQTWFDTVQEMTNDAANAEVKFVELGEEYHRSIKLLGGGQRFDIVLVDGRDRVESAIFSFDYLTPGGVIILDDSARPHYSPAFDFFRQKGYKALTLVGLKPTGFSTDTTTIFYKSGENCLDL